MPFFATPFRVLFHDTMAYGTHHFLTNFKFQCVAREEFLFGEVVAAAPDAKAELDDIVLVTQQAYSRNLAPVAVGETVGILMTYEDPTPSSLRFCFRVIRRDGAPVSCGFQTMVCLGRKTQAFVSPPSALLNYASVLLEPLSQPSFLERVVAGQLRDVFDADSVALGMAIAAAPHGGPRIVGASSASRATCDRRVRTLPRMERELVFLLPGQGSYHSGLFAQLRTIDPGVASLLGRVDDIARSLLGVPLALLADASSADAEAEALRRHPELAQLGMYLGGVVVGRRLLDAGLRPDLLAGHSAGELAALAVAGAYSIETGTEVVCHRAAALATVGDIGGMVALGCDLGRAQALIDALGASNLEPAVLNDATQTVISGAHGDLDRLERLSAHVGVSCQRVASRYPFHSELMRPAVDRFAAALGDLTVRPTTVPVYSPIDRAVYAGGDQLASLLPSHLVRRLDFFTAINELYAHGARQFVECGGGDVLTRMTRRILDGKPQVRAFRTLPAGWLAKPAVAELLEAFHVAPAPPAPLAGAHVAPISAPAPAGDVPIAIVALGCVLPGAADPESLWRNVVVGASSIRDAELLQPEYAQAFLARGDIVPDKTYTLLGGAPDRVEVSGLPAAVRAIAGSSSSARLLASATAQCLAGLAQRPDARRTHFLIGSTADGTLEHDEALLIEGLVALSRSLDRPVDAIARLEGALRRVFTHPPDSAWRLAPFPTISAVADALVGPGVKVVAVDAACASSLYALNLAVQALRDGDCDVAMAGGVFAPGPANSCLFAQFGGLSSTGSRPFEADADGVVFCSGAAMAVCKRLPDALRDGDRVLALIRGIGTSSDGKSPSVSEPKESGQVLAIERAYAATGIDPASIQYVEAHATSTPLGDAVEFSALTKVFGRKDARDPRVALGSVKALIGHTGWAAGAASLVKVCQALAEKQLPPQANFTTPNPRIDVHRSPFALLASPQPWPRETGPRRAAINGFGFGGTNAHLIVEELEPEAHADWRHAIPAPAATSALAVVGVGALFPWTDDEGQLVFSSAQIRLPRGRLVLPDAQEHIDRAQFLALMAADAALRDLGDLWRTIRDEIGVVLGVEGKTMRSLEATQRIYADFVRARLARRRTASAQSDTDLERSEDALFAAVRSAVPSNSYTLPGLMPNVVAGRVANFFDLHGPNLVLDAGPASLLEAMTVAERMLRRGECKAVLAGGIGANARPEAEQTARIHAGGRLVGEAALVLAVVTLDRARAEGMPIRAILSLSDASDGIGAGDNAPAYLLGAEGAWEVAAAIAGARRHASSVTWKAAGRPRAVDVAPVAPDTVAADIVPVETVAAEGERSMRVQVTAPRLQRIAPCRSQPTSLSTRRLLVVVDRPVPAGLLAGTAHMLLCPADAHVEGAIPIDLTTEESTADALRSLDGSDFDLLVALTDLSHADPDRVLAEGAAGRGLLELLLVAARRGYSSLQQGRAVIAALTLGAWRGDRLEPYTGLLAGFLKALARELPGCSCKVVHSDDPAAALAQLEAEVREGPASPVEIAYREGVRHAFRLVPVESVTRHRSVLLDRESVVVATGGARGVTAALVEVAIERSGCRAVLLGRTDLDALPPALRELDDLAFDAREQDFYREEVARTPGVRVRVLRDRWAQHRAVREVLATLARLRAGGARVDYLAVDIIDAAAVDRAVGDVVRMYGRVDLVLHGAGLQASCVLTNKKIADFRRIVATKLGGLLHLQTACARHLPGRQVHFHLLTSAFSFFGNDGQVDYGAANQAIDRLTMFHAGATGPRVPWTSVAWLGWAGVGMTRGSEYAALARVRGLRPLGRDEGKAIFAAFLDGPATEPVNVLVSEGELRFYGVDLASGDGLVPVSSDGMSTLSLTTHPFLRDHCVNAVPTMPGTFELELAVRAAHAFRPERCVVSIEQAAFDRFVKVHDGTEVKLRTKLRLVEENEHTTLVEVAIYSDFVHKSGRVLQEDLRHFSACVRLADRARVLPAAAVATNGASGIAALDPYLAADSPVRLDGLFRCLESVRLHAGYRTARFRIADATCLSHLTAFETPSVLLDAMARCAVLELESDGAMPVWVPISAGRTLLPQGVNDASLHAMGGDVRIHAVAPRFAGDRAYADHVEAVDGDGRVILVVNGLVARRAGRVRVA